MLAGEVWPIADPHQVICFWWWNQLDHPDTTFVTTIKSQPTDNRYALTHWALTVFLVLFMGWSSHSFPKIWNIIPRFGLKLGRNSRDFIFKEIHIHIKKLRKIQWTTINLYHWHIECDELLLSRHSDMFLITTNATTTRVQGLTDENNKC